jgi:antibiotic biosynthesis monooxygenase
MVDRFAESRGHVRGFPGFVSMEVLKSSEGDEVLVVTRLENRASFDAPFSSSVCTPTSPFLWWGEERRVYKKGVIPFPAVYFRTWIMDRIRKNACQLSS